MSTAELPRSKKHLDRPPAAKAERKCRRIHWGRWLFLSLLLAVAYSAPAIVANSPLRTWILQNVLPLNGSIVLESVSIGWFSSVMAQKLTVYDAAGEPVVEIDAVSTEKPLVAMLLDLGDFGVLHVEHPTIHVVAHEAETNLEQTFAPLLQSQGHRASAHLS
jgi:translocation and assembly module TamB